MSQPDNYLHSTRHPLPCLLFLLPLLALYEVGVLSLGGVKADALRNGIDAWMRWGLWRIGLRQAFWVPILMAIIVVGWGYKRRDDPRPKDLLGALSGIGIESVIFALGLWGLSRGLGHLIDNIQMAVASAVKGEDAVAQVVTFVGAGIYEEVVFRLLLFSALLLLMEKIQAPLPLAVLFAALASAACFSAAHHVGPYGEAFDSPTFVFRLVAGLYFALIYQLRGLGVAAGAHACYDVLAGVSIG